MCPYNNSRPDLQLLVWGFTRYFHDQSSLRDIDDQQLIITDVIFFGLGEDSSIWSKEIRDSEEAIKCDSFNHDEFIFFTYLLLILNTTVSLLRLILPIDEVLRLNLQDPSVSQYHFTACFDKNRTFRIVKKKTVKECNSYINIFAWKEDKTFYDKDWF